MRALALAVFIGIAGTAFAQEAAAPAMEAAPQEDPKDVVGAPRGKKLAGAELETRTEEVGGLLRCPVCQGLSVADSPAAMATNMKGRVRELLAEGYDEEQILAYFERSYGEFVRLEPQRRGINWLVWLAPPLALVGGLFLLGRVMRRRPPIPRGAEPAPAERAAGPGGASSAPLSDDDPYLLRVRELAYGWPGGKPPADAA